MTQPYEVAFVEIPTSTGRRALVAPAHVACVEENGQRCVVELDNGSRLDVRGNARAVAAVLSRAVPGFVHAWTAEELSDTSLEKSGRVVE